jgi:hypothetical protein
VASNETAKIFIEYFPLSSWFSKKPDCISSWDSPDQVDPHELSRAYAFESRPDTISRFSLLLFFFKSEGF